MKTLLDYVGTGLAMVSYMLIVNGYLLPGFGIGIIASACMLLVAIVAQLHGLKWLQLFFIAANIYGVYNLWSIYP